jgi:hypothetical protein
MPGERAVPRWRGALGELLIIILGVLIALWAENWREALQDRGLERTYLERLSGDLRRDTAEISEMMELTVGRARYAGIVLEALETGEPGVSPEEFIWAVEHASFFGYPAYSRATFDDLMSTGNLRLLRSDRVKEAMSLYYSEIDGITQFRDLYVPFQQALGRIIPQVLELEQRYAVFDNLPVDYESPFPWAHGASPPTGDEADAVLDRLRSFDEVPSLYAAMARTQGRHHANQARLRNAAIALLGLIEQ